MVLAIKRRRRQIICRLRFFIAGIYMDVIVCLQKKYEGVCLSNRNCAKVRKNINVNDK